jgi:hypothetical protein
MAYPYDVSWTHGPLVVAGNPWFVDSTASNKANDPSNGDVPARPWSTVAYALTRAAKGDVIYCMPGHAETISTATGFKFATAGVKVVGLGDGSQRPTFTVATATTATVLVSAAGCGMYNCVIDGTGIDAVAAVVSVQASDFTIANSYLIGAGATNQAVLWVSSTAAADRMKLVDNIITGTSDAGATTAIQVVGGDGIVIQRNMIMGAFTTTVGGISNITTAMTNALIAGNQISNVTASSTKCITAVAGSTGMIVGNALQILSGTAPITAAGMSWVGGNYYAATIATGSTLV